jgi:hypothetical protein
MTVLARVFAIALAALLSCLPLCAQQTPNRIVEHVSPVAPESLNDLWNQSSIIVVANIDTATAAPRTAMGGVPDVYTAYTAHVSKTLKGTLPPNAVLLQKAGRATVNGVVAEVAGEPVLEPGSRYVLFVNWNPVLRAYVLRGSEGAFRISREGVIQPLGRSEFAERQRGRSEGDFLRDIASRRELATTTETRPFYVDPSLIGSGNFAVTTPTGNGERRSA